MSSGCDVASAALHHARIFPSTFSRRGTTQAEASEPVMPSRSFPSMIFLPGLLKLRKQLPHAGLNPLVASGDLAGMSFGFCVKNQISIGQSNCWSQCFVVGAGDRFHLAQKFFPDVIMMKNEPENFGIIGAVFRENLPKHIRNAIRSGVEFVAVVRSRFLGLKTVVIIEAFMIILTLD